MYTYFIELGSRSVVLVHIYLKTWPDHYYDDQPSLMHLVHAHGRILDRYIRLSNCSYVISCSFVRRWMVDAP